MHVKYSKVPVHFNIKMTGNERCPREQHVHIYIILQNILDQEPKTGTLIPMTLGKFPQEK